MARQDAEKGGEPGRDHGRPCPGTMPQLGSGHIAQPEVAGDFAQRPALDRGLPENQTVSLAQFMEDRRKQLPIDDGDVAIRRTTPISSQQGQRGPESLAPPEHIETVIAGNRHQPGAAQSNG
jgi:hypothetical protein